MSSHMLLRLALLLLVSVTPGHDLWFTCRASSKRAPLTSLHEGQRTDGGGIMSLNNVQPAATLKVNLSTAHVLQ